MVKVVTMFHKHIWGVGVCLNVCVCRVSYRILSLRLVLTWGEGGEQLEESGF